MALKTMIEDLYLYNDWAHERLFRMSDHLTEAGLDQPFAMGFGSLRATMFHILSAEQIWLERWNQVPWREFPTDPRNKSMSEIASELRRVAAERQRLLDEGRASGWKRVVTYRDSRGHEYSNPLDELLLHVANHSSHHRAQALHYLKRLGQTTPGGIDYVFYRLARPTVPQEDATAQTLRGYGLEVATGPGVELSWDRGWIERYFAYHDWATARLLTLAETLDDVALDQDFGMGPGSIRKTVLHLHDAERWWLENWTGTPGPFPHSAPQTSLAEARRSWSNIADRRNAFIASQDSDSAARIVAVFAGGPPVRVQVIESLIQLCTHGTHHRAQLSNMLRQSNLSPPPLDFIVWRREG